jgi:hypothetical protein
MAEPTLRVWNNAKVWILNWDGSTWWSVPEWYLLNKLANKILAYVQKALNVWTIIKCNTYLGFSIAIFPPSIFPDIINSSNAIVWVFWQAQNIFLHRNISRWRSRAHYTQKHWYIITKQLHFQWFSVNIWAKHCLLWFLRRFWLAFSLIFLLIFHCFESNFELDKRLPKWLWQFFSWPKKRRKSFPLVNLVNGM